MARGLGPTPCILIIVAHVCNYNVNTELCGPNQQDFVERKKENMWDERETDKDWSQEKGDLG